MQNGNVRAGDCRCGQRVLRVRDTRAETPIKTFRSLSSVLKAHTAVAVGYGQPSTIYCRAVYSVKYYALRDMQHAGGIYVYVNSERERVTLKLRPFPKLSSRKKSTAPLAEESIIKATESCITSWPAGKNEGEEEEEIRAVFFSFSSRYVSTAAIFGSGVCNLLAIYHFFRGDTYSRAR